MGVTVDWKLELVEQIKLLGFEVSVLPDPQLVLYRLGDKLLLNLLDTGILIAPAALISIQEALSVDGIQLVNLWEDIWIKHREQVLSRLESMFGLTVRIHGRKTTIISLTQPQARKFMDENHLQLSVSSRYKYGLLLEGELVAAACFSALRRMKDKEPEYRSAEIIRFANKNGYTVTGGFTKLLRHFIRVHKPNDVMSYADRDWSLGAAYERSGFKFVEATPPSVILLHKITLERIFPHRAAASEFDDYIPIFNTGNLKYILDL